MNASSVDATWDFEGRDELESVLTEYDIDKKDICLVGSISLSVRGLRKHGDVDFCVSTANRLNIDEERLDFVGITSDRYSQIGLSDDELIENEKYHDVIDGFKVVRPEITFSYKKIRDLPKDEADIELLEQYSQSTDDWDWDLYRADYTQRPNSLLSRGLQSLRTDGVFVTADKAAGLVMREYPAIRQIVARLPVFDLRTPYQTVLGRKRTLTPAQLMNRQYSGDKFVGLDVVAYWIALDKYERDESCGFDTSKLETDIETLAKMDIEAIEPLPLSQRHRVLRPDHLARLLHEGQESISTAFTFKYKRDGDKIWLQELGLSDKEKQTIIDSRIRLLDEIGMLFYAMFWPLTHEYHDEMETKLREKVAVVDSMDVEIDDIETFVHDIYDAQTDTAPDWAISWKGELMTRFPPVVRIVKIELPNPRLHDGISREMEMVKNDIRHQFMHNFEDKHYLSILHATDSFEDNLTAKAVIESYR